MQGLSAVPHLVSASKADASNARPAASLLDGAWEERPPPAPILQTRLGRMPSMARPSHLHIQSPLFKHLSDGRFSSTDRFSSSSSRSGQDATSLSLATMVYRFMDEDSEVGRLGRSSRSGLEEAYDEIECLSDETDEHKSPVTKISADALQVLVSTMSTAEQKLLETLRADDEMDWSDGACKSHVIKKLRNSGYDAALCISKWDSDGTLPGGEYEYIDIILRNSLGFDVRLILDLDFSGHFKIARPTRKYRKLLNLLPSVFFGTTDKLRQIISTMCEAAKVSLQKRGLHLPPWRKSAYISAKWFSPHVRISSDNVRITAATEKFESVQPKPDLIATESEPLPRLELKQVPELEECNDRRNLSPEWKPPFTELKNPQRRGRLVGLTAAFRQSETAAIRKQKMEKKILVSALNPLRQHHEGESAAAASNNPKPSNSATLRSSIYSKGFMKGF